MIVKDESAFTVNLLGRYYSVLSVLPYILLTLVFFFIACFFFVMIITPNVYEVFEILLLPFLLGMAMFLPFSVVFIFMIRWHGKRRLEFDNSGVTMVLPNEKSVFVPWEYLIAVELRFAKPNLVQCTLISSAMKFSFSNLEINLQERVPLKSVFAEGFGVEKLRELLYYLHRKAPQMSWRMGDSFKQKYNVLHPPYDLERMT